MFIPPNKLKESFRSEKQTGSKVCLKASHLLISQEVVSAVFGEEQNVYVVYYPDRRSLLLAPVSDEAFKNMHKAGQQMLKDRNLKGDKSIALHEILIDHQIEDSDRGLEYEFREGMGILKVQL